MPRGIFYLQQLTLMPYHKLLQLFSLAEALHPGVRVGEELVMGERLNWSEAQRTHEESR